MFLSGILTAVSFSAFQTVSILSDRLSESAVFAFLRVYPSRSDEMFKSVITDAAVDGEPLKSDAEIDTASSTDTLILPSESDFRPLLTNGTAR